jgi:hypothetical protein
LGLHSKNASEQKLQNTQKIAIALKMLVFVARGMQWLAQGSQ